MIISMKNKPIIYLTGILFSLALCVSDITAQEMLNYYAEKYPGALGVRLLREQTVTIDIRRGALKITKDHYDEMLHLAEQSRVFTSNTVYHSGFSVLKNWDAYTLVPRRMGHRKIKVTDYSDITSDRDGVFYHDSKERRLTYPAVGRGVRTVLAYQKEYKEPRLLSPFYFQSNLPVEKVVMRIKAHKNVQLKHVLLNTDNWDIIHTTEERGRFKIHTWELNQVRPLVIHNNAPALPFYAPHLIYYIESYEIDGASVPVLKNLNSLNNWYWSLFENVIFIEDEAFEDILKTIIHQEDTEKQKVQNIYDWVQRNIRYIAINDGMRGFVPDNPLSVLRNRYGDCKDMSVLLHALLFNAGIESHLALIGTRSKTYRYTQIPTPITDNHMIVAYKPESGRTFFLDATQVHGVYGLNPRNQQGKEVLITMGENRFVIDTVAVEKPYVNLTTDTASFVINNHRHLHGSGIKRMHGYPKQTATRRLLGKSKNRQDAYVRGLLAKGGWKYHIDDYHLRHLDDNKKELIIKYDCRIEDYVTATDDNLFVNMNFERRLQNDFIDVERRQVPVEHSFKYKHKSHFMVQPPLGYMPDKLPQNRSFHNDKFGFKITYEKLNDQAVMSKEIFLNTLLVEPDDFEEWNNFIRSLNNAYRESVVFRKIP